MTTEEKARAYDEALERVRQKIDAGLLTEDDLSYIFPQLRESEDERIRKWIITELKDSLHEIETMYSGDYDNRDEQDKERQAYLNKALAYLEKQKEQKSALTPERIHPKFAVGDTVCRPMWSDHTIREIYVRCNDPVYVCVNDEGTESHISFSEQDEWERKEQNPAGWSEEDEKMRIRCIEIFDAILKSYYVYAYTQDCKNWCENRLKSLRPQPHWKPSNEQMNAFENAIKCELSAGLHTRAGILQSLLDDLQNYFSL